MNLVINVYNYAWIFVHNEFGQDFDGLYYY